MNINLCLEYYFIQTLWENDVEMCLQSRGRILGGYKEVAILLSVRFGMRRYQNPQGFLSRDLNFE